MRSLLFFGKLFNIKQTSLTLLFSLRCRVKSFVNRTCLTCTLTGDSPNGLKTAEEVVLHLLGLSNLKYISLWWEDSSRHVKEKLRWSVQSWHETQLHICLGFIAHTSTGHVQVVHRHFKTTTSIHPPSCTGFFLPISNADFRVPEGVNTWPSRSLVITGQILSDPSTQVWNWQLTPLVCR